MNTTKKKGFVYTLKKNKVAYAYVAPFYILFAIFGLFPIVAGFGLSFFRWDGIGPMHIRVHVLTTFHFLYLCKEQRMCLGTLSRLRRSLATSTLYVAVRIPAERF